MDTTNLPNVFIWSPLETFSFGDVLCPKHASALKVGFWTDNVIELSGHSNPRLAYGVNDNVLIIQRSYGCEYRHR